MPPYNKLVIEEREVVKKVAVLPVYIATVFADAGAAHLIPACRLFREIYGCSLSQSKHIVNALWTGQYKENYTRFTVEVDL